MLASYLLVTVTAGTFAGEVPCMLAVSTAMLAQGEGVQCGTTDTGFVIARDTASFISTMSSSA